MASVTETVERSLTNYPMLHSSRMDVLHFLFCVIGNGYLWVDGELVDEYEDSDENGSLPWSREEEKERLDKTLKNIPEEVLGSLRASFEAGWDECEEIVKNASTLAVTRNGEIKGDVYPQSKYARLLSVPEDVKADWAEAAEEVRVFVRKHGWKV